MSDKTWNAFYLTISVHFYWQDEAGQKSLYSFFFFARNRSFFALSANWPEGKAWPNYGRTGLLAQMETIC